jgi:hypothetical protein
MWTIRFQDSGRSIVARLVADEFSGSYLRKTLVRILNSLRFGEGR